MDRHAILSRLKEHEAELRRGGVARVALFGSVARSDVQLESDIDRVASMSPTERA